ncbi:hypothetical protein [Candidatus Erwinia dacicola]|uniref:Uncharacterized protein n=2 Tax=Candidatus Erwinia dacicola TaxID=252393 RepID=A0A1E7Z3F1_9GAMM|nr:hypothetical protein [Candidatus Erwinia dacicola]OFC63273.1 hypothetical protein BBW68_06005 [Candidatus Erwinia dacicola]
MSELTKEWLQQTIAELEEERDATPGAVNEDAANALAAMKLALASLEARSRKLFTCSACGSEGLDEPLESKCHCHEDGAHWIESVVYTAPPAPFVLPVQHWEELCRQNPDMSIGDAIMRAAWWNHCAAMLQGAGGNSPVIPDGWVLVPVELTGEMTNAMTDAILDDLHNVDVWRSVLAAAPQREVK